MNSRPNKYGARQVELDGHRFSSEREARRYAELKMLERAGEISNLTLQPEFPIVIDGSQVRGLPDRRGGQGRPIKYTADFAYTTRDGRRVVEEVKGGRATDTTASRLRRALVQHIYRLEIEVRG